MATLTLLRQNSPLASPHRQREILGSCAAPDFQEILITRSGSPLHAQGIDVLQVNVGKLCNQACRHCHVDAGPDRREIMSAETVDLCLKALERGNIPVLDITGGAPEMHPDFRRMVRHARGLGRRIIDRCNLTILLAPRYEDLPTFLADQGVEVIASLPCYLEENTDRQRGDGVFAKSIEALRRLNDVGYGKPGTGLPLTLVFNPQGSKLPPSQSKLELEYRKELAARYGVIFTRLITITNMPISRFLDDLMRQDQLEDYLETLVRTFNPATVQNVMCRTTLSVSWDGWLYDCDFNQMLDLGLVRELPRHIRDFDQQTLAGRAVATGRHCFGCTAGQGSSCQGATSS